MDSQTQERSAKILVVDDDPSIRRILHKSLRRASFDTIEAASGEEAIAVCQETNIDLAVLDIHMAKMSGVDTALALNEHTFLPFIFITADRSPRLIDRAIGAGALGYIVKPIEVQSIPPQINSALSRAHQIKTMTEAKSSLRDIRLQFSKMMAQQEEERRRVVVSLHDELNHPLIAIRNEAHLALSSLQMHPLLNEGGTTLSLKRKLATIMDLTGGLLDVSYGLISLLRPESFDKLSLDGTVDHMLREFRSTYGIYYDIDVVGNMDSVPEDIKLHIYRILKEVMTNAVSHRQVKFVGISLLVECTDGNQKLHIGYQDDGSEFDESINRNKLLKTDIKERLLMCGGTYKCGKSELGGVIVDLFFPIR